MIKRLVLLCVVCLPALVLLSCSDGGSESGVEQSSTSGDQTSQGSEGYDNQPTDSQEFLGALLKSSSVVTSWPCIYSYDNGRRVYYKFRHHKSIAKGTGGACRAWGRSTEKKAKTDAVNCCNRYYSNCSTYDVNGDVCGTTTFDLTSPNGGQKWNKGKKYTIKWTKGKAGGTVKIQLLKSGKHYRWVAKKTKNDGKYTWKIPTKTATGSAYKIKITSTKNKNITDKSRKNFSITGIDKLKVIRPNGGEPWIVGKSYTIRWDKGNGSGKVKIQLLKADVASRTIIASTTNDGKYTWKIPTTVVTGSAYKIKVTSRSDANVFDSSDSNFTITVSPVKVTSPNGGENWNAGSTHTIKWDRGSAGSYVKIYLYKSGSLNRTISTYTSNDGSYSWSIPSTQTTSTQYKIRVQSYSSSSLYDDSDSNFTITKSSVGDITGSWSGWWTSSTGQSGSLAANLTSRGSTFSGTATIYNSYCFGNEYATGTVSGSKVTLGVASNAIVFIGTLSGSNISGLYEVYRGACSGDSGSFSLTK